MRGGDRRVARAAPGRVLDRLGHQEIRGCLDHLRVAALDGVVEFDQDGRTVRERRERRAETRLGQDGRVDAVGQLPELTEAGLHVGQRLFQQEPGPVVRFGVGAGVYEPE